MNNQFQNQVFALTQKPAKRKVFISYHHQDQAWVNAFRQQFSTVYDLFQDCSLDEAIESDDLAYVHRTIREDYITGTSITIVVCGADTWKRKCVDWEIHSTLNKDHALLAVALPHNRDPQGQRVVPGRLHTNIQSGYGHWIDWTTDPQLLQQAIQVALQRSKQNAHLKDNSANKMLRNK